MAAFVVVGAGVVAGGAAVVVAAGVVVFGAEVVVGRTNTDAKAPF